MLTCAPLTTPFGEMLLAADAHGLTNLCLPGETLAPADHVRDALADHPLVGEVRGMGLLAAVEITADKASKKPFPPEAAVGAWIQNKAMENGVIVRAIANCVALCPPLISERKHIDELVDGLSKALDAAQAHFGATVPV